FLMEGDRTHLANVVYNLIDNAIKYSPEQPQINLSLKHNQDFIELSVADQGRGIGKEYHSKIFDQFFRVPQGNRHDVKGYGLGLAYVKQVVKLHGGEINFESTPGKGTRFTAKLPTHG